VPQSSLLRSAMLVFLTMSGAILLMPMWLCRLIMEGISPAVVADIRSSCLRGIVPNEQQFRVHSCNGSDDVVFFSYTTDMTANDIDAWLRAQFRNAVRVTERRDHGQRELLAVTGQKRTRDDDNSNTRRGEAVGVREWRFLYSTNRGVVSVMVRGGRKQFAEWPAGQKRLHKYHARYLKESGLPGGPSG
jgi:hypothetical protein